MFGETYVVDVPDLPIVLRLLRSFDEGKPFTVEADAIFENYCLERGINSHYLQRYLAQLDRFLADSLSQVPQIDFIGFTTWSSNMLTTLMAAAHLKRRPRPPFIVLGGPQVTESQNSARLALQSGLADSIALGEGEETLLALFESFRAGRQISATPGTLIRDQSGSFIATERKLMRLATKPLPDFSRIPILDYQGHGLPLTLLPFEISRGCTDKCTFCSEWVFWRQFRSDSVEHVISDIEALAAAYPIQGIWFIDSLLNGVKSRLVGLAEAMLSKGVKLKWGGFMRADIDEETARLITRAGCDLAFLGVESLSDETLDLMNKRRTSAQNLQAIRALLDAGMSRVVAGVIPGFPGDTRKRFMATALQLREIHIQHPERFRVNVEPFTVSPGQPLYAELDKFGLDSARWTDDVLDIAPRYRNITDDILCTVSGSNQGIDRLGELRVATTINAVNKETIQDPFAYSTSEDISVGEFSFIPLACGFLLGRFKSPGGFRRALLVTDAERRESGAFDELVERIASQHVIAPGRTPFILHRRSGSAAKTLAEMPEPASIMLSPFALCRRLPGEDQNRSLLVNIVNPVLNIIVADTVLPILARLAKEPVEWSVARSEIDEPTLAKLLARGFLDLV